MARYPAGGSPRPWRSIPPSSDRRLPRPQDIGRCFSQGALSRGSWAPESLGSWVSYRTLDAGSPRRMSRIQVRIPSLNTRPPLLRCPHPSIDMLVRSIRGVLESLRLLLRKLELSRDPSWDVRSLVELKRILRKRIRDLEAAEMREGRPQRKAA